MEETASIRKGLIPRSLHEQFDGALFQFDAMVHSDAVMCRIYDAFVGPDDDKHNCLGCNLQDLSAQIANFLQHVNTFALDCKPHHTVSLYLFLLNTLWERISDVMGIIGVPDEYRARHFEALIRVRRWANFFKHPKEFAWMVHHPTFVFEYSDELEVVKHERPDALLIDDDFLKKFYSCDRMKGLTKTLRDNRDNITVVLPNVECLTEEICECIHKFVDMITDNPVYREMLEDKCTINNYYAAVCSESDDDVS